MDNYCRDSEGQLIYIEIKRQRENEKGAWSTTQEILSYDFIRNLKLTPNQVWMLTTKGEIVWNNYATITVIKD